MTTTRRRTTLTQAHLKGLEEKFAEDSRPSNQVRAELARQLSLNERTVQIWFQNRRTKARAIGELPATNSSKRRPSDPNQQQPPPQQPYPYDPFISQTNFKSSPNSDSVHNYPVVPMRYQQQPNHHHLNEPVSQSPYSYYPYPSHNSSEPAAPMDFSYSAPYLATPILPSFSQQYYPNQFTLPSTLPSYYTPYMP